MKMEKQYKLPKKWTEEKWIPALLSGKYKQGMGIQNEFMERKWSRLDIL